MKELTEPIIYKAGPVGLETIPDLRIIATEQIPNEITQQFKTRAIMIQDDTQGNWEKAHKEFFRNQATLIFEKMLESLPGGTFDYLFAKMAEYKASILKVPL